VTFGCSEVWSKQAEEQEYSQSQVKHFICTSRTEFCFHTANCGGHLSQLVFPSEPVNSIVEKRQTGLVKTMQLNHNPGCFDANAGAECRIIVSVTSSIKRTPNRTDLEYIKEG
jgi:hypothetical protein